MRVWAATRWTAVPFKGLLARRSDLPPRALDLRRYSSTPLPGPVLAQLRRVSELQARVALENSKTRKQALIAEYPDLRELLEHVYDPSHRNNLSFASIRKHISENKMSTSCITASSITELLDMLSTRQVAGNVARDLVLQFLIDHDILGEGFDKRRDRTDELETFGRILDRNLVAGFGARTLSSINWTQASTSSLQNAETLIPAATDKATGTVRRNLESFPVALGKSIEPPFAEIAKSSCTWYASRKLDGVRVITFLDFLVPADPNGIISFQSAQFFSRTGKPFTSLSKVEERLRALERIPNLQQWLGREAGDSASVIDRTDEGVVKRLVLDGEICVLRQKHGESSKRPDEGTGAGAIWSDDNLEEDFPSTVSEIRRGAPFTIPHPVYFIFDILPHDLFEAAKGPSTFGQRVNDIRDLGSWLAGLEPEERVLRPLTQWEVKDGSEIDGMVARAAEEGWEGLVLRADKAYKGSRSTDIRKFKKWLDAEYTVTGVDNSRMRLPVNGVFGEHEAMANIWIEHKGTKVSVGSGFTADQRLKYGSNPELIEIGKEVTVEYFSESTSAGREGMSLRFPRVKQIWTEGKRTI